MTKLCRWGSLPHCASVLANWHSEKTNRGYRRKFSSSSICLIFSKVVIKKKTAFKLFLSLGANINSSTSTDISFLLEFITRKSLFSIILNVVKK